MGDLFNLLKQGNKSALIAAIVNAVISVVKGIAFSFTGNVAMFAEMLHSLGDAANQFFVFIGSALSKKAPTRRFPNGFGRLVNLVLIFAVAVVSIMAWEAIKEGYHHIFHPTESKGFLINIAVLAVGVVLESFVLFKAMKEILHETGSHAKGLLAVPASFANLKKAKPATKLVFMEDLVATSGGLLAIIAIIISHTTPYHQAEGLASMIIGFLMFGVVVKVFFDNAAGVIGEADSDMEQQIGEKIMQHPKVDDIQKISVVKEGESLHVNVEVEVKPNMPFKEVDDIRDELEYEIKKDTKIKDVTVSFDETDKHPHWEELQKELQTEEIENDK
ncbi:cation diffusion facilitator family transporter [Priestia megaterium]|nr:cation diffusion facilitator family transporter [Priestia megaterium]